jgi:hypothetical protein
MINSDMYYSTLVCFVSTKDKINDKIAAPGTGFFQFLTNINNQTCPLLNTN